MTVSDFINSKLKDLATTFPVKAPSVQKDNYIVYSIDSIEPVTVASGRVAYRENFVTITVYGKSYNNINALSEQIISALDCSEELNIMGTTLSNKTIDFVEEPVDLHSVALEFSIYER